MSNAAQKASELAGGEKPSNGELRSPLAYWKTQLADLPAALELPTDRPRTSVLRFHAATHAVPLPLPLTEALQQLSCRERVPLAVTLLAAFQTLLQRYSGQEEIVVGSPRSDRSASRTSTDLLVLRTDLSGNPAFQELLHRVREV